MADNEQEVLVPVNAKALQCLLIALNGPDYFIREMQATRNIPAIDGEENPINLLVNQFNDWANKHNQLQKG